MLKDIRTSQSLKQKYIYSHISLPKSLEQIKDIYIFFNKCRHTHQSNYNLNLNFQLRMVNYQTNVLKNALINSLINLPKIKHQQTSDKSTSTKRHLSYLYPQQKYKQYTYIIRIYYIQIPECGVNSLVPQLTTPTCNQIFKIQEFINLFIYQQQDQLFESYEDQTSSMHKSLMPLKILTPNIPTKELITYRIFKTHPINLKEILVKRSE
eukprot:TRINITY_DN25385_c1_g2_i3.p1 TRINITY_DN25385_c1_g2~~TRINITY_DN25385_c1_g2_i3.p1  ORF type:complete len:209 (+),score=-13.72 TRINITY_DN25385_c1_g2_i3:333-959(+)